MPIRFRLTSRERMPHAPPRVLIVGSGIGGLCLAQGLHTSGIGVTVFERDESAATRNQGYGFHIKAHGRQALRDCLPPNLFDLYVATSAQPTEGNFALCTSQLRQLFTRPLPRSDGDPSRVGAGVNRQTLREILLAGLGDVIRFGKDFSRFTQLGSGQVAAHFADGTSVTGDLLVGADRAGSMVRSQLVPGAGFDDHGRAIYGKTPLTRESAAWPPAVFLDGMPRVAGHNGISMGAAAYRKRERFADATARLYPGLPLTDTPDYLRWTLSAWDTEFPITGRAFWEARGAALHRVAAEMVADWHPTLRRVIDEADAAATFPFGIFSAQPVGQWNSTGVTLLGDAIHTMTPGRGEGANTSLRDAALLRARLIEVAAHGRSLTDAKSDYEQEMLRYGFEAVAGSKRPYFAQAMMAARGRPPPDNRRRQSSPAGSPSQQPG